MIIGVLKEPEFDNRVSLLPEAIKALDKLKAGIIIENEAGVRALASDEEYIAAGAQTKSKDKVIAESDILLSINPVNEDIIHKLKKGQVLISIFNPLGDKLLIESLKKTDQTYFSMDLIPRTSRGQAMDVLSSMATISGYKAVLDAAMRLPKFFPMFMTAAGTIRPVKMLILGAGVAGLQAIAIARKLGAVVEVFDVRTAVKEQVQSLGGKFIEVEGAIEDESAGGYALEQTEDFIKKQRQLIHDHAVNSSVIICTAQIPGKKAPLLLQKETVDGLKPGSVIIDLAASTGGNCYYTQNNKVIDVGGVKVVGNSSYPSEMPNDASRMYGNNLVNFLKLLISDEGNLQIDFEDNIIKSTCIIHANEIISERLKPLFSN